jgi:anaerobic magnesium-protoporphyrin IX monomethyl ester cyclase
VKVLFLIPPPLDDKPPAERIFGCNYGIYAQPNIFILYPATVLKEAGHTVELIDFPINGKGRSEFERLSERQDYDVVVFYTVFLSRKTDIEARDILSKKNPATRFVFISTEPSASPDDFVNDKSVVIRGEPESRVGAVMEAFAGQGSFGDIPGISFMGENGPVHNGNTQVIEDLDSLPFPDRLLLDSKDYHNPKLGVLPFTTMVASRGCSFGCYYCVPNSQSFSREIEFKRRNNDDAKKPPVRLRSAGNVVDEFKELANAGYKGISFLDDQFVWGAERTNAICSGIEGLGVEWSCLARADMLQDREMVAAMGRAGCRYVDIGIESFTQEILDYIGKGHAVDAVYPAVENLKAAGIEPELNILIGACPLETESTIEHTFEEVLKLDVDYVLFSVCTPFPYTRFNARAKHEGWMIKPEYEPIDPIKESFVSYPHLTKEQLDKSIRSLYRRYYFRPGYMLKRLRKVRSFRDLVNKTKAALSILK